MDWEPKIVGFACNWCTYAGADLAGTSRLKYPPNLRLIRVMCTGRLDVSFVLTALLESADGIFVGGCHRGDCHYLSGNAKALRRVLLLKKVLSGLGIDPERVKIEWISASEAQKLADAITFFTEEIRKLGPNPLKALTPQ